MKLLVIGSGGMLGHVTTLYLRELGFSVTDISRKNKINDGTLLLDVLHTDALTYEFLSGFDAIINCAALLVDASEKNKTEAIMLNSWFPRRLESVLRNSNTKIIQISTDGVFSGKAAPYTENSYTDARTFYGKTKILGEVENDKDLTVRASFVGPGIHNGATGLFHWLVRQTGSVRGYSSVFFNAVTSLEFAKFIVLALNKNIKGIYHLGASETISKSEFLCRVSRRFELKHISITEDASIKSDNTLVSIYNDLGYAKKTYDEMLCELKLWMHANKELYHHYSFL